MGKDTGKKLLCAQVNTPLLYMLFNWVFSALFVAVLFLSIFFNTNTVYNYLWYGLLAAMAGGVLFTLALYGLFTALPQPGKGGEIATVTILMVLLAVAQFFVGWNLQVVPENGGMFGVIYGYASNYVLNGTQPGDFFALFPNNIGLYSVLCGFFSLLKLFGITQFGLPLVCLSLLAVDGALLLLYFACKRLFGVRQGLYLLVIALLTAPFYLYLPLLYSDILILPIPIAMVVLWLSARSLWREGKPRKAAIRFGILTLLAVLGILLKFTVVVVWLAIAIDLLLYLRGKDRPLVLLVALAALGLFFVGGTMALRHTPLVPPANYGEESLPASYEIMNGLGGGDAATQGAVDQQVLQAQGNNARKAIILQEMQNILAEKGPLGFINQLGTKLSFTFGDGSYGAAEQLRQSAAPGTALYAVFTPTGAYFPIFGYLSFGLLAAVLFWMIFASVRSFMRKNYALTFVRVGLFGLVLTLLIWQAEARYLIGFLPLLLLCAVEAAPRPKPVASARKHELLEEALPRQNTGLDRGEAPGMPPQAAAPDYMNPSFQWEKELKQIHGQDALPEVYPEEGAFSLDVEPGTELQAKMGESASLPGILPQAEAAVLQPAQGQMPLKLPVPPAHNLFEMMREE